MVTGSSLLGRVAAVLYAFLFIPTPIEPLRLGAVAPYVSVYADPNLANDSAVSAQARGGNFLLVSKVTSCYTCFVT